MLGTGNAVKGSEQQRTRQGERMRRAVIYVEASTIIQNTNKRQSEMVSFLPLVSLCSNILVPVKCNFDPCTVGST